MVEPIELLISNRWDADQCVYNYEYKKYTWLKPIIEEGKRTGITKCCFWGYECNHHKKIKNLEVDQKPKNN